MWQTRLSIVVQVFMFSLSFIAGILVSIALVILEKKNNPNKISQEIENDNSEPPKSAIELSKLQEDADPEFVQTNKPNEILKSPHTSCSIKMDSETKSIDEDCITEDFNRRYSKYSIFP